MATNMILSSLPNIIEIRNCFFPRENLLLIVTGLRSFVKDINENCECKINDELEQQCAMFIHIKEHQFLDNDNNQLTIHFSKIHDIIITVRFYKKNNNECVIEIQRESGSVMDFSLFIRKFREWLLQHYRYDLQC